MISQIKLMALMKHRSAIGFSDKCIEQEDVSKGGKKTNKTTHISFETMLTELVERSF